LLGLSGLWIFHLKFRMDDFPLSIAVLLVSYTFYKVNHLQFHTNTMVLLVLWYILDHKKIRRYQTDMTSAIFYCLWISILQGLYVVFQYNDINFDWLRDTSGLPTFILSLYLLNFLIKYSFKDYKIVQAKRPPHSFNMKSYLQSA